MTKQLIFIFLFLVNYSWATEVISEDHLVQFHSAEFYSEKVTIIGETSERSYLPVSISERSELISVQLGIRKGSKMKFKEIKDDLSYSSINWSTYFDGSKKYLIEIPEGVHFEIRYTIESNYSLFFSAISDKSDVDAGITHWRFEIPDGYQISTNTGEHWKGYHQLTYSPSEEDEEIVFLNYHPSNTEPEKHFNSWFWSRTKDLIKIDPSNVPESLKKISQSGSRQDLAKAIFRYVQNNTRYVDIENGVNAVIPRSATETLTNKYGDCKDMSTLLVSLYNHFGFEAYNAISKTNRLDFEFNFPSIAMANHMICVLELDGELIFLDATEDVCEFGDPSIQIYGTEVLPIRSEVHDFIKIPFASNKISTAFISYSFDWENSKIIQSWTVSGKFNTSFLSLKKKLSKLESSLIRIPKMGSKLTWKLETFLIQLEESMLQYSTPISNSMLTVLSDKKMLDLNYLQSPEKLFELLFWNEKPLFNGKIELVYNFNSAFQSVDFGKDLDEVEILQSQEELDLKYNFELDNKSIEDFSRIKEINNKLTAKPIIIYNEN